VVLLLQAGQFKYNADDAEEEAVPIFLALLASQLRGQQHESAAELVIVILHLAQERRPALSDVQSYA